MKITIEKTKREKKVKNNTLKKNKNNRKVPVLVIGKRRKSVLLLWIVLCLSLGFAIYKNFTAIDRQIIHEKVRTEEKLVDTIGIQSYVESFVKDYFTWENRKAAIENRTKKINGYFTEELQQLNQELIRTDIPTSSQVQAIHIFKITQKSKRDFQVNFTVEQRIIEGKKASVISSAYQVTVHQEGNGDKAITQNPTITSQPGKSNFHPKQRENDSTIDSKTRDEVTKFLKTFFKLYPKATKDELAYYVKDKTIQPLNKNYLYSELETPIFRKDKDGLEVEVSVKYLNQETKATLVCQYQLKLEKKQNWRVITFE
ncbi:MAG: conjugal transfer protein [Clostridium perfringens]|uniref:conjugal transfer protein n=1 Tax=Enterococcus faecalis TaxID=1351 RepID=UPI000CF2D372|nr:conjugal transfer protein [Enterococcus faecalis]MDU5411284.1 conjugal transfer protein [Clostridium perfringens]MDU5455682.1 conjugal transfer protein [Pseudescherichia vulneris]EGO9471357.1 conjugal transfer protein [Enterococcus faecalis]EHR4923848.1 conjugal transfer protein [Enterococcus faecalis]EIQ7117424.1 conjugal transfer protein [Enterococcus faecalis]